MNDKEFLVKLFPSTPLSQVWVGWSWGDGHGFPGGPADEYLERLPQGAGHYFCIGSLKLGRTQRRLGDIDRVHALVLDDIGTKAVDVEAIAAVMGRPDWIMETSKGNFQWGWRYAPPVAIEDWDRHRAAVELCVSLWGVDRAGADPNRLVRLPSGVNLKPGRGLWPVELRHAA